MNKTATATMVRKVADCRMMPNSSCQLTISGPEEDVLDTAVMHAVAKHGYKNSSGLRDQLRDSLLEEEM